MYILASGSPRRRELMNLITKDFVCEVSGCDEFVPDGTPPCEIPALLARQKAQAVAKEHPSDIVIGSDTIVVQDGKVFGKPKTPEKAGRDGQRPGQSAQPGRASLLRRCGFCPAGIGAHAPSGGGGVPAKRGRFPDRGG